MKYRTLILSALMALSILGGNQVRAADNMASITITPATGVVTLASRWTIGGSLAGFHFMAQDLSLGGGANQFYSIKGTAIPAGGDTLAFNCYIAASGAATPHADIGSKLTPNSYSALTSADPDIGYGSVNFYLIHHKASGDYFTVIDPGSATSSAVTDLKPMSGPGGPGTLGASGYFGLTFAAANLGYGLNLFYYLRTDPGTGFTKFGTLDPALLGTSTDEFDLGISGHNALEFTGTDVGYGVSKMYYLRLDPVTGFTIFGTLHPLTGKASDIANLGSVYSTLTFVPGDVGFGTNKFYTTGTVNPTGQSVSFAAIADRAISAGSFTVAPSASSGLPIALTVVSGSTGAASISGPVAGVFTVTPTAPGRITLQATQAGTPGLFEFNMLRQSFTISGTGHLTAVGWNNVPVTGLANAADGSRAGAAHSSWDLYYYKGTDNRIWGLYWTGSAWAQASLVPAGAANVDDWLTSYSAWNSVYYKGTDNHLWCVYYNGTAWVQAQLSTTANLASDVVVSEAWNVVFYRGTDNKVWGVYWDGSQWVQASRAGTANVAGGLAVDGEWHLVYYKGTDNKMWAAYWNGSQWVEASLGGTANVGGAVTADQGGLVYYRALADSSAWAAYWNGAAWLQVQLDPTANMGSSTALYGHYDALFLDSGGQCEALHWNGSAWGSYFLGDGGSGLTGGLSVHHNRQWVFARRNDGNVVVFYYQ